MIVSHANRYVYLRNPKAASTSIANALVDHDIYATADFAKNPHCDVKALLRRWKDRHNYVINESRMEKWLGSKVLERLFSPNLDDYTVVVTVRNPWARFYSAFNYLATGAGGKINDRFVEEYLYGIKDFNEFMSRPLHPHLKSVMHFRDQSNYIAGSRKGFSHFQVHKILKIEEMEKIDTLFKHLTNNSDYSTYYINTTLRKKDPNFKKPYTEYYNSEQVEIVRDFYKDDLEILDYEFGD